MKKPKKPEKRWPPPKPEDVLAAREETGDTQEEAGERVKVARRTWQDYELGNRKMLPGLLDHYLNLTARIRRKAK